MSKPLFNKKVAIVVEELTQLGGAERILDAVLEIFPNTPIFTIVWDKDKTNHLYDNFDIRPSFIQKLPWGIKKYKWYLTLMPRAIESFNLKDYDIVFSITSALVKGVKTNKKQIHICYCNTPTRYLWIDSEEYIKHAPIPIFVRPFIPFLVKYLRKWDLKASKRPDYFIANSLNIQARIEKYYHRKSDVIYPNVDTKKFNNTLTNKENYYLLVSRLEPYKKVELVIEAFRNLEEELIIVGSGSKIEEIKTKAPKNVTFLGRVSDEGLAKVYAKAKGFIFPQDEDFGITPVEAMAAGTPVIAYKKGGALETVVVGKTGEFFFPQTPEALAEVVRTFKPWGYKTNDLQAQAAKFDKTVFKRQILEYIISKLKEKKLLSKSKTQN